jgi:hypothetical protein
MLAIAVQCASLTAILSYVTNWPTPAMAGAAIAGLALFESYRQALRFGARWPNWHSIRGAAPVERDPCSA